jgi:hypothetical protein
MLEAVNLELAAQRVETTNLDRDTILWAKITLFVVTRKTVTISARRLELQSAI